MNKADPEKEKCGATRIALVLEEEAARELFPMLQRGFGVRAFVPCTIRELLCDQFGLEPTYVSDRITTIFLNGKPTDSLDEVVREDSTIALSAAMPGLVGATMRRGSFYATMRSAITLVDRDGAAVRGSRMIRIKLFNLMLDDLGLEMLVRGVIIPATDLADFFRTAPPLFWEQCHGASVNGMPIAPLRLRRWDSFSGADAMELSIAASTGQ